MRTKKFLFVGSALVLAAALGRCSGGSTTTPDGGSGDMAAGADMAAVPGQPTLTSFSPPNAFNSGGTMVTITGTNFKPGATVSIGGVMATAVTVVSSTQITCMVPAKAATCGLAVAQVTNPDGKSGSSNGLFTYRSATFGFAAAAPLAMAATTRYVIAADLDNDGDLDLVSANSGAGNLAVRLNNGNGTYAGQTLVPLGGMSPFAVAAIYLDADNKLDLVTVLNNPGAGQGVRVRLGVGNGTFTTPAVENYAAGASPVGLAVGDLDGDQKTDLLVLNGVGNNLSTLISNGDGTLKAAVNTSIAGTNPSAVVLANFDQGGKLDFATSDKGSDTATVRTGVGNGTFGAGSSVLNITAPSGLVAGDFNGDSVLDLAIASSTTRTIRVTIGVGDSTFNPAQGSTPLAGTTLTSLRTIAAGDFNLDGNLDIVVANQADKNLSILLGQGNGSFNTKTDFPLTANADPTMVTVADLNKDGILDIVTTDQVNDGVIVLMSQCQ